MYRRIERKRCDIKYDSRDFNIKIDSLKWDKTIKWAWFRKINVNFLEPFAEAEIDIEITPLICACYFERKDVIKMLMKNKSLDFDLSSKGSSHTTLGIACMTGNYEII